jgi:hypothetical protein
MQAIIWWQTINHKSLKPQNNEMKIVHFNAFFFYIGLGFANDITYLE